MDNTESSNEKDIISQEEIDLTEAELNKIFFDKTPSQSKENDEKLNKIPNKPIKLHSKTRLIDNNKSLKDKLKEEEKIEEKSKIEIIKIDENKNEQPLIKQKELTYEKVQQIRKEREDKFRFKKIDGKEKNIKEFSLNTGLPLTKVETEKLIDDSIEAIKNTEEYISNKRDNLKKILKDDKINFLNQKSKCLDHLYHVSYFENNEIVAACKNCSNIHRFDTNSWNIYLSRNRKML